MQEHKGPPPFDRVLWMQWILASTLGWLVGWAAGNQIVVGLAVGVAQWVVLKTRVRQAGWWILASVVGWTVGTVMISNLFSAEDVVLPGAVLGATAGIAQWLVLRRWCYQTGWWPVTSTLSWAVGPILGLPLVGAVVGAVTGFTLELLLRYPRPGAVQGEENPSADKSL